MKRSKNYYEKSVSQIKKTTSQIKLIPMNSPMKLVQAAAKFKAKAFLVLKPSF